MKTPLSDLVTRIRLIRLRSALQTLLNTWYRDHLDDQYIDQASTIPPKDVGLLRDTTLTGRGMKLRYENASLELMFLASDLVCLSWEPGVPPPAYSLAKRDWGGVKFSHRVDGENIILETNDIKVCITNDGGLIYSTPGDVIFREELPPIIQGRTWTHHALLQPESRLYGLGERAAPLNLRGGMYVMWNNDPGGSYGPGKDPLYFCAPLYLEKNNQGSYLVFYENPNPGYFTLTETATATFQGGALRYFVIPGPIDRALSRFSELTGKPNLPPLWALGYHQSRWGYKSEQDIRRVVEGFEQHNLPLSAIHLDIDYMDGYRVFTVNQKTFPNLPGLAQELLEKNIHLVAIIDPGVKKDKDYAVYRQGMENKYFVTEPNGNPYVGLVWPGQALYPDFTNPKARAWWADQYAGLIDQGIHGFWHDMNEPTSFVASGDHRLPLALRHDLEGQGGDHQQGHNLYGHTMAEAGFTGQQQHNPSKRPWLLTRSAWVGTQRFAWSWTGDIESTWDGLRICVPMVLNLGLSGQPFSGPDIGGFSGTPTAELYVRWFELSTFLPFFRTHSAHTTDPREPWVFGEATTDIVRKFLRLRYQLMPFFYSLAWVTHQTGFPIARPLFWPDQSDDYLWDTADEFLLGENLLVAPILHEGSTHRKVTLPPGRWYNYWTGELANPVDHCIDTSADLDSIPLFCKEGSLLPLESMPGTLELQVFAASAPCEEKLVFQLYTDAGDGTPQDETEFRVDSFYLMQTKDQIIISHQVTGSFPLPFHSFRINVYGWAAKKFVIDGETVEADDLARLFEFQKLVIM